MRFAQEQPTTDDPQVASYGTSEIDMHVEPLEFKADLVTMGLSLWGSPIKSHLATRLHEGINELLDLLSWDEWPPTIGVSQISISTEPTTLPTPWTPPEITRTRVSIVGFGFVPGVPVRTKWNNAFGFPDNGVGRNSIMLPDQTPDTNGRFAFQTVHRAIPRPANEWRWEANSQLVIVAQQGEVGSPSWREASQRYIPPHVLWQWVPHALVVN